MNDGTPGQSDAARLAERAVGAHAGHEAAGVGKLAQGGGDEIAAGQHRTGVVQRGSRPQLGIRARGRDARIEQRAARAQVQRRAGLQAAVRGDGEFAAGAGDQVARLRGGDAAQRRVRAGAQGHALFRGGRAERGKRAARLRGQHAPCLQARRRAQRDVAALGG